jgi:hypothetical protein
MRPSGDLLSLFSLRFWCRPSIIAGHRFTRLLTFFVLMKIFTTARPLLAENNSADHCLLGLYLSR